jgi:hypothetical protein
MLDIGIHGTVRCTSLMLNFGSRVITLILETLGGWAVLFHTILTPNFVTTSRAGIDTKALMQNCVFKTHAKLKHV